MPKRTGLRSSGVDVGIDNAPTTEDQIKLQDDDDELRRLKRQRPNEQEQEPEEDVQARINEAKSALRAMSSATDREAQKRHGNELAGALASAIGGILAREHSKPTSQAGAQEHELASLNDAEACSTDLVFKQGGSVMKLCQDISLLGPGVRAAGAVANYDGIVLCCGLDNDGNQCAWGVSRHMLAYSSPVIAELFESASRRTLDSPPIISISEAGPEVKWLGKIVQRLGDPFRIRDDMPSEMVWRTTVLANKYQCLRAVSTTLSSVIVDYRHAPLHHSETMWMILSSYAIGDATSFARLTHELAMTWESNTDPADRFDQLLDRANQDVTIPLRLIASLEQYRQSLWRDLRRRLLDFASWRMSYRPPGWNMLMGACCGDNVIRPIAFQTALLRAEDSGRSIDWIIHAIKQDLAAARSSQWSGKRHFEIYELGMLEVISVFRDEFRDDEGGLCWECVRQREGHEMQPREHTCGKDCPYGECPGECCCDESDSEEDDDEFQADEREGDKNSIAA